MQGAERVFRSRRVATGETLQPAAVWVRSGSIAAVTAWDDVPQGAELVDCGELALLPGLVDTHVHLNEPGRTEWEGFATGTAAAAAGGVTTLVEMPLNAVPATTTVAALATKVEAAKGKLRVDVGFWGGAVPGNRADLRPLWEAGVFGFKCFLVSSGVDEFPHLEEEDLRAALAAVAALGAPLLAHAELPRPLERAREEAAGLAPNRYATWLALRPSAAEQEAIGRLLRLGGAAGARLHVVHLAAGEAAGMLAAARRRGVVVTAETCPHYLFFAAEEIPDGATEHKCAPPIRDAENRERLWQALGQGVVEMVVSDHSPCPPELKRRSEGDFVAAWGGIASLELGLAAVWTEARRRALGLDRVVRWMATAPAALAGMERKGRIAPGCDADLVAFDPEAEWTVDAAELQQRHDLTPYAGRTLRGRVLATYLRGEPIFAGGAPVGEPAGRVLRRGDA